MKAGASPLLFDAEGMSALHMCCAQGRAQSLFEVITVGHAVRMLNELNVRNTLNVLNNQGESLTLFSVTIRRLALGFNH